MVTTALLAGGVGTGVLVGGAFGARHAFEADHVAAVATLVEGDRHPASTGAAWGVGHSLPVLALGAVFLGVDLRLPAGVATGFELLVGVVLVALGVRVLAGRDPLGVEVLRHVHGDGDHRHLGFGDRRIGLFHSHEAGESLAVGVVHGLAGSGGVVVALAAASPTLAGGAAFLVGFAAASVVAMAAASWLWGRALGRARGLRRLAGVASIAVGLLVLARTAGYTPAV